MPASSVSLLLSLQMEDSAVRTCSRPPGDDRSLEEGTEPAGVPARAGYARAKRCSTQRDDPGGSRIRLSNDIVIDRSHSSKNGRPHP
jgi:hypothetical protein